MKAEILRLLRETDGYVSGQELCNQFGVSRTAVWKAINQLKEAGYEIEAVQNKGYHLVSVPDRMDEVELASIRKTEWAGAETYYFDKIDSTNTKAKRTGRRRTSVRNFCGSGPADCGKRTSRTVMGFPSGNGNLYDTHAQTGHQSEPCIHADPRDSDGSGKCNAPGDGSRGFDQMAE